jgi:phospholipid transport system substrate-binding protein
MFFVLFPGARPAHGGQSEAIAVIELFHANLLAVMKEADVLGIRGRYERLASPIEQAFHLPLMIRIATGSFWRSATASQKNRLLEAFARLSISTYADRFDGYGGESFETVGTTTVGTTAGPRKTLIVQTRILRPQNDPVGLSYVMRLVKGRWLIVDVLLDDSVSELAVRRSEYRHVLKTAGVDDLIQTLNTKAAQLVGG